MPLSEYEQRVLEQMERQLSADDPKLATTLTTSRPRTGRKIAVAAVSVLVGLLLLVLGVMQSIAIVGILGFLVMFGGVTYAILGPSREAGGPDGPTADAGHTKPRGRGKASGESFMQRMEDRWDKRKDSDL